MNFLQRLKAQTQPLHRELEEALPLGRSDLTRAQYGQVLQAFSAVVPALEARLLALELPAEFQVESGLRAELLARDLAFLGLEAVPPLHDWSALTPAAALGALYVLEGSRLGGAVIARSLAALGLTPEQGGAYFAPVGDLGGRWRAFGAVLARQVAPADEAQVLAGADETFGAFLSAWRRLWPLDMVGA